MSKGFDVIYLDPMYPSLNKKNLIVGVIIRDSQVNGSGGGDVAAPSFANFIASAFPIPLLAPVIHTFFDIK